MRREAGAAEYRPFFSDIATHAIKQCGLQASKAEAKRRHKREWERDSKKERKRDKGTRQMEF